MKDTQKWRGKQDEGKRPRGRPRQTREDGIKDGLNGRGTDMAQAKNWAKDCARWRALCKPSTLIGKKKI
jgi:hypothetical protein